MKDTLSILIPARNEMFLERTIQDIVANIRGNTDVFVLLDGYWPDQPIKDYPNVTLVHAGESVGQRAGTNMLARLSKGKYILKCDAHCAFDEGFDVKLMSAMQPDWTMVPVMRNLHAFDWICQKCGHREYQGVTPNHCPACDNKIDFKREIMWVAKTNPQSVSYCFDSEPHFQYFREYRDRPEYKEVRKAGPFTETMSLQGSCFMLTRDKYWELNICDEDFGSWGTQGIEVAVKTWLSGGRVIVNHNTWYAHMFRTKGGDFGFPYPISGRQTAHAKKYARGLFYENRWPLQKRPLSWLLEKFWPVPGWTQQQLDDLKKADGNVQMPTAKMQMAPPVESSGEAVPEAFEEGSDNASSTPKSTTVIVPGTVKGIVYYTDNRLDEKFMKMAQEYLLRAAQGIRIVSVSLEPIAFGENIVLPLERSYLTMFKQQLAGIEALEGCDIIFMAEHDVLYNKEHFEFTPLRKDIFYYNMHNWQTRQTDGHAVYWDCKKVSQICGYRDLMLKHYRERVRKVEEVGFSRRMGFEPGTHGRPERVDDTKSDAWRTVIPNLDVRHRRNLTASRWSPTEFRNPCKNWQESHVSRLPGWEGVDLCGV